MNLSILIHYFTSCTVQRYTAPSGKLADLSREVLREEVCASRYMVAAGMGITVLPQLSVPAEPQPHVKYIKFTAPVPTRRVVLAWRRTFPRYEAIAALRNAVYACKLEGVARLS